jgi:hypothetical protein
VSSIGGCRDGSLARTSPRDELPGGARLTLLASWCAIVALRLVYLRGFRFDTDEPQHLHVVWSWVRGLVQYRDVFDNHAPLFHLLMAPVAAAVGERPGILMAMRVAMLPLSAATLWSTYVLGRALFGRAVGAWATVFAALVPNFFLTQVEFRTDALWTTLWLLSLAVLLGGPLTRRRAWTAGLLLGATFCTSLKTVLFLGALASAIAVTIIRDRRGTATRTLARHLPSAALGFVLVPVAIALFFARRGAFGAMIEATITHNVLGGIVLRPPPRFRALGFVAGIPVWWLAGAWAGRSMSAPGLAARRCILVLTTFAYILLLEGLWPIATRQDVEPWTPLAAIVATAAGVAMLQRLGRHASASRTAFGGVVALAQIALLLFFEPPWSFHQRVGPEMLADVLRLTDPSDTIMDLKGETVFRDRPFYYVLEIVTLTRMQLGVIPDTIPEALVAHRTCVAAPDDTRFPERARAFLRANYISVGRLRVAGRRLAEGSLRRQTITFDVAIPADYAIIAGRHPISGWVDGHPCTSAVFLGVGRHRLRVAPTSDPVSLVWATAVERGFLPVADASADSPGGRPPAQEPAEPSVAGMQSSRGRLASKRSGPNSFSIETFPADVKGALADSRTS